MDGRTDGWGVVEEGEWRKSSPDENPKSVCPAVAAEASAGIAFNLFS